MPPLPPVKNNDGINRFGGWIRDRPDPRDVPRFEPVTGLEEVQPTFGPPLGSDNALRAVLPVEETPKHPLGKYGALVERWDELVGIYEQRPYESCVSCAVASVIRFVQVRDGLGEFEPSRLFLYYNARYLEGYEENLAVGTGIRSAIKGLQKFGVCAESDWSYLEDPPALPPVLADPTKVRYKDSIEYKRIFRLDQRRNIKKLNLAPIRRALSEGSPVICGFTAFRSFVDALGGGVSEIPFPAEEIAAGKNPIQRENGGYDRGATFGHAAVIIGSDGTGDERDEHGTFLCVNSWGQSDGDTGFFTLPAEYLAHAELASDFWTITSLT